MNIYRHQRLPAFAAWYKLFLILSGEVTWVALWFAQLKAFQARAHKAPERYKKNIHAYLQVSLLNSRSLLFTFSNFRFGKRALNICPGNWQADETSGPFLTKTAPNTTGQLAKKVHR